MKFDSFLENLYFGRLDWKNAVYSETPVNDPKVMEIMNLYTEAIRDFPPDKLEALGRVPEELLQKLKKTGFFGLFIPEKYGGVGLTLHQYLTVVKEIVKYDMALGILSLAHLSIGVKAILLFSSEEQKKKYLPLAASGDMIFCYALTEVLFGSDAKNIDTVAELSADGDYYILNGSKTYITNANYSGGLTVFAQLDPSKKGNLGAFIVETAWDGVSIGKDMEKMGLIASSTASLQFKNVKVPKENLIGKPGDGFKIAMTVLNYGRLALGAASCGMMEASYQNMVKRAKNRVQFEKPIIEYELIQEKIVKAFVENEAVWSITNFTAGILEKDPVAYAAIESSHCKLYGTNRAWETLYDAMQVAGGSGYLKTNPYEKRMRDFRVATIFEGTTEIHSMYPPVSLLRNFAKQVFVKGKPAILRWLTIAFLYIKPALWKTGGRETIIKKAYKAVKHYAGIFRRMFLLSAMKYGKKMPDKEFLLRRLTAISCRLFIILSMALRMAVLNKNKEDTGYIKLALKYYLAGSDETVRINNRIKPNKLEIIHKSLMNRIYEK